MERYGDGEGERGCQNLKRLTLKVIEDTEHLELISPVVMENSTTTIINCFEVFYIVKHRLNL